MCDKFGHCDHVSSCFIHLRVKRKVVNLFTSTEHDLLGNYIIYCGVAFFNGFTLFDTFHVSLTSTPTNLKKCDKLAHHDVSFYFEIWIVSLASRLSCINTRVQRTM